MPIAELAGLAHAAGSLACTSMRPSCRQDRIPFRWPAAPTCGRCRRTSCTGRRASVRWSCARAWRGRRCSAAARSAAARRHREPARHRRLRGRLRTRHGLTLDSELAHMRAFSASRPACAAGLPEVHVYGASAAASAQHQLPALRHARRRAGAGQARTGRCGGGFGRGLYGGRHPAFACADRPWARTPCTPGPVCGCPWAARPRCEDIDRAIDAAVRTLMVRCSNPPAHAAESVAA
jgi:hypothetical protein